MKKITDINDLHLILLDMAKVFHEICVKNNIPYWMLGGTMLGAVRHKGFIPWDDDMDFGIPREYYHKFIEIAEKELPNQYQVLNINNSDRIISGFSKIELRSSLIEEKWIKDPKKQIGINIDIFPIDKANNNFSITSNNRIIVYLMKLQGYVFFSLTERPLYKKIIAGTIKMLFYGLNKKWIPFFIEKYMIKKKGSNLANHFGNWGIKEIVPKEYMGEPQLYKYENIELYGVREPDKYLTNLYGDWKTIPKTQHIHILEMYLTD